MRSLDCHETDGIAEIILVRFNQGRKGFSGQEVLERVLVSEFSWFQPYQMMTNRYVVIISVNRGVRDGVAHGRSGGQLTRVSAWLK